MSPRAERRSERLYRLYLRQYLVIVQQPPGPLIAFAAAEVQVDSSSRRAPLCEVASRHVLEGAVKVVGEGASM